jgi:hypothetical protein
LKSFLCRHPEISLRTPEYLSLSRVRGFAAELVAQLLKYTNPQWTPFNIILQDDFFFFFNWAPVASAPGSTAACRLIGQARLWKFPLVPPGTPRLRRRERPLAGKGELWAKVAGK